MKKVSIIVFSCLNFMANHTIAQVGLYGEYYSGQNFNQKIGERFDSQIDFDWAMGKSPMEGMTSNAYSIRWTGMVQAPESGTYTFSAKVDDGIRVWVGNIKILDAWGLHDSENFSGDVVLEKGKKYGLKIEYFNGLREGEIHLLWETPEDKKQNNAFFSHNYKPIKNQYLSTNLTVKIVAPEKKLASIAPPKPPIKHATETIPPLSKSSTQTPYVKKVPKPIKPINLDTVTKYTPKNVLFEKSKAIMLPESFTELDNLAAMLKRFPNKKIIVEGHTDNIGDAVLNVKLSEERAKAVGDYLIKKGITSSRIVWQGFGGTRPVTNEDTSEGHAKNRRVEFIIR